MGEEKLQDVGKLLLVKIDVSLFAVSKPRLCLRQVRFFR